MRAFLVLLFILGVLAVAHRCTEFVQHAKASRAEQISMVTK